MIIAAGLDQELGREQVQFDWPRVTTCMEFPLVESKT